MSAKARDATDKDEGPKAKELKPKTFLIVMPYQDVDDITEAEPLRSPGTAERWMRKIFIED